METEYIYLLTGNGYEWEDLIIFLSKEEGIERTKKFKDSRLEIFCKSEKGGYHPTYNYYENGVYFKAK